MISLVVRLAVFARTNQERQGEFPSVPGCNGTESLQGEFPRAPALKCLPVAEDAEQTANETPPLSILTLLWRWAGAGRCH